MMKRLRRDVPDRVAAEEIGLRALVFMTQDNARLSRFLRETGLTPDELRQQAAQPGLQAAILEYLLGNESELLVFAADAGIDPQSVDGLRALLAGESRRWEPSA
jgi:hypothetical protein